MTSLEAFQIRSDEELAEMIESVREYGVLVDYSQENGHIFA